MNRLSRLFFFILCTHPHKNRCILLTGAEIRAVQQQHQLIKEIRERLLATNEKPNPNLPTEVLLSEQCYTLPHDALRIMAYIVAAYNNNGVDKQAAITAMHKAEKHHAKQCTELAHFWQITTKIHDLELMRMNAFEEKLRRDS